MTDEQYKQLEERLDRLEAKVDVASHLIAIRIISSIGDQWGRLRVKGRELIHELWKERGIEP